MDVKMQAQKWAQQVVALHQLEVPPHLEFRKRKLIKQAEIIRKSLEATDPLRPFAPISQELGFLPILIGGGILAVTAMSKWAKDAYAIKTDKEKYDALVQSGLTPAKAQEVMTQSGINWKTALVIPAILFGGFVVYKLAGIKRG